MNAKWLGLFSRRGGTAATAPRLEMSLSIIVPVWNEAQIISSFLQHLRERAPRAEIIVVDGESNDGSDRLCAGLADQILHTGRNRARQMNAGAAAATGNVLWFLHADSRVPIDALPQIEQALRDPRLAGGCFRLRFPRRDFIYRISDSLGNLCVDLFGIALGDHGFFCRREAFLHTGGFPEIPLMEDAEFYRALRRTGATRQLRAEIETSPRRYEEHGAFRTTAFYLLILALYVAHGPLPLLAKIHSRFTVRHRSNKAPHLHSRIYEPSIQT